MNRIIKKISIITAAIALFIFAMFATIETMAFMRVLKETTDDKLLYETRQFANQMSMVFENAEGSVDALCAETAHSFDMQRQMADPSYVKEYMREYAPVIRDALVDIEDSQGLYITFAPEITDRDGAYEIWYSYDSDGVIRETDAMSNGIYYESFEDEDYPTMQYYFDAVKSPGEGVWTEPYLDSDIDQETMAYSRAVYADDMLIGVIGTDIYTAYTTDLISDMEVDNEGMVFLMDEDNHQIISSHSGREAGLSEDDRFWKGLTGKMESRSSGDIDVSWNGEDMSVSFSQLSNDWKLAIVNYEDDLYRTYENMLGIVVALSSLLVVMLAVGVYLAVRYFSSPVDRAIKMLSMMDLETQLDKGELTEIRDERDIEEVVRKAMKQQQMKDIMLANRSRQASAGEMMANVVHQWKQPLNNINIILGNLKDDIENGDLSEDDALAAISRVENMTTDMSETLRDFSDYLKPDREIVSFEVRKVIEAAVGLLQDKIRTRNIIVTIEGGEGLRSGGYRNSLYHVILNVVNNAIDAIDEKGEAGGQIAIKVGRAEDRPGKIEIEIFNDGVPLSESSAGRLFSPYYTTKSGSEGTGLGLAISKHFIEQSMGGDIRLENYRNGVRCVMTINEEEE